MDEPGTKPKYGDTSRPVNPPDPNARSRPCLRCAEIFASNGFGNRLCKPCISRIGKIGLVNGGAM